MKVVCHACNKSIREDEVIWINQYTLEASTGDDAVPYCVPCCPAEVDSDADSIKPGLYNPKRRLEGSQHPRVLRRLEDGS